MVDKFRGRIILALLSTYPFYSYVMVNYFSSDPNYLSGIIVYFFGAELLITSYSRNKTIAFPKYLLALGAFFLYTLVSSLFISDLLHELGPTKYIYRDPYLRAFVILLVIENTVFDKKAISFSLQFLFGVMVVAAMVSLRQVYDPLFYANIGMESATGASLERYQQYLETLGTNYLDHLTPIKEGYRYSIYSWISGISVGLDSLSIFSILLGLRHMGKVKSIILFCSAGFISFLSSSRWIMLNFLTISSQRIIGKTNPLFYSFKLILGLALLILIVAQGASYFGVDLNKMVQDRLLSESAGTRIYAFEVFGKVFHENPIFGTGGVDTERMLMLIQGKTSQIHVGWLKILYYHGLIGTLIYATFIFSLLTYLFKLAKVNNYWGSFFALLAFVVANGTLVEFSIYYHGLLLAILFAPYLRNETIEKRQSKPSKKPAPLESRFTMIEEY
ncbi:MAG: hypothetical protein HKN76_11460 [Saprospiraceae bacterium]|nr:hypothetical protein [Saprospiraceae bacterium]